MSHIQGTLAHEVALKTLGSSSSCDFAGYGPWLLSWVGVEYMFLFRAQNASFW